MNKKELKELYIKIDENPMKVAMDIYNYVSKETCGECSHCRLGVLKLLEGVDNLNRGEFSPGYFEALIKLANCVVDQAKCDIGILSGQTFIAIINYWRA